MRHPPQPWPASTPAPNPDAPNLPNPDGHAARNTTDHAKHGRTAAAQTTQHEQPTPDGAGEPSSNRAHARSAAAPSSSTSTTRQTAARWFCATSTIGCSTHMHEFDEQDSYLRTACDDVQLMAIRRPDMTLAPDPGPQVCAECGQPFESESAQARYCTFACRERARDRRKYHARRGRVNGEVESFNLREIAERDNWACHVCAGPVTSEDWSIDHLMPISQGGQHTRSNVALAHLRCNAVREYETQAPPILASECGAARA